MGDRVGPRGEKRNVPSGRFQVHSTQQRRQPGRSYLKEDDRLAWFSREDTRGGTDVATSIHQQGGHVEMEGISREQLSLTTERFGLST